MAIEQPKLLDQVRACLRTEYLRMLTDQDPAGSIRRFILFRGKRHPKVMRAAEFEDCPNIALRWWDCVTRAKESERLPIVLAGREVRDHLARLSAQMWLIGALLYGKRMRLFEGLRLRVKEVDFARAPIP